jgi:uncharacterized protein (TIGR03435 family)
MALAILNPEGAVFAMRPMLLAVTLACGAAYSQTPASPSFEVASIKPSPPLTGPMRSGMRLGCGGGPGTSDPGMWTCSFTSLAELIIRAYNVERYQFTPADWMRTTMFDIIAKVPAGTTKEQFQLMQQNLLAERFKLTVHHEQKEMVTYELTVGKNGLKMKESAADAAAQADDPGTVPHLTMGKDGFPAFPAGRGGMIGLNGHFRWTGVNVTIADITKTLSGQLGRPVIDATGLKGKYDIDMTWIQESMGGRGGGAASGNEAPVVAEVDAGPTITRAIQEQLGLRVDSKKGPGDILVVDHAEKVPIEN